MYRFRPDIYFEAGARAVQCIDLALSAAQMERVGSVLDFGAAGGRVLRSLKAAFPDAELSACEYADKLLDFCGETFGARTVPAHDDPDQIELDSYDLIWVGSVLTHLDRERWPRFVRLFASALKRSGVVVFTTYGRFTSELLRDGTNLLNLTPESATEVLKQYDRDGFGYAETRFDGDAVAHPAWVCSQLPDELSLLLYMEHAWLGQDVVACTRR